MSLISVEPSPSGLRSIAPTSYSTTGTVPVKHLLMICRKIQARGVPPTRRSRDEIISFWREMLLQLGLRTAAPCPQWQGRVHSPRIPILLACYAPLGCKPKPTSRRSRPLWKAPMSCVGFILLLKSAHLAPLWPVVRASCAV
jgi:hypothetical protein